MVPSPTGSPPERSDCGLCGKSIWPSTRPRKLPSGSSGRSSTPTARSSNSRSTQVRTLSASSPPDRWAASSKSVRQFCWFRREPPRATTRLHSPFPLERCGSAPISWRPALRGLRRCASPVASSPSTAPPRCPRSPAPSCFRTAPPGLSRCGPSSRHRRHPAVPTVTRWPSGCPQRCASTAAVRR